MIFLGVVLLAIGLPLASAPEPALRGAAKLRSIGMPADPTPKQLNTWRLAGAVVAAIGLVLVLAALL